MNRTHRTVWNGALGAYVAAPETAPAARTGSPRLRRLSQQAMKGMAVSAILLVSGAQVFAGSSGGATWGNGYFGAGGGGNGGGGSSGDANSRATTAADPAEGSGASGASDAPYGLGGTGGAAGTTATGGQGGNGASAFGNTSTNTAFGGGGGGGGGAGGISPTASNLEESYRGGNGGGGGTHPALRAAGEAAARATSLRRPRWLSPVPAGCTVATAVSEAMAMPAITMATPLAAVAAVAAMACY